MALVLHCSLLGCTFFLKSPQLAELSALDEYVSTFYNVWVNGTLRNVLVHPIDPFPAWQKANVVYNITCLACPKWYIGQTAWLLDMRIKEHKVAVRKGETETSAVAEHVWEEQHQMDWSGTTILAREVKRSAMLLVYTEKSYHQPWARHSSVCLQLSSFIGVSTQIIHSIIFSPLHFYTHCTCTSHTLA